MSERDHVTNTRDASSSSSDHVTSRPELQPRDSPATTPANPSPTATRIAQLRDRTTRLSRGNIRSRDADRASAAVYEFPSRDITTPRDSTTSKTSKSTSHDVPALLTTISSLQAQLAGKDAEISHLKAELTKSHHVIQTLKDSSSSHVTLDEHNALLETSAKRLHEIYGQKVMSKVQKYRSRKQSQVTSLKDRISRLESALNDSRRENSELVAAVDEYIDVSKTCDES